MVRAVLGVAYGMTGAYVGAILFLVTVGITDNLFHLQRTEMLWTRESLSDLFLFSLAGIFVLSWWIVPLGVFFGVYFCPRTVTMASKSSCDQRHPAWGRARAAHSSILHCGISA